MYLNCLIILFNNVISFFFSGTQCKRGLNNVSRSSKWQPCKWPTFFFSAWQKSSLTNNWMWITKYGEVDSFWLRAFHKRRWHFFIFFMTPPSRISFDSFDPTSSLPMYFMEGPLSNHLGLFFNLKLAYSSLWSTGHFFHINMCFLKKEDPILISPVHQKEGIIQFLSYSFLIWARGAPQPN